jgi:thioredoxin-like negative regulator of GroEL
MSNHSSKWTVNENAIDAISFIKTKTNVSLNENYQNVLEKAMGTADAKEKERIETELKLQEQQSYKERIETLTEKFKNDPVKLAVLSKLAQELSEVTE